MLVTVIVRGGADASVSEPAVQMKATTNEMRRFFISNSFKIKVKISSIVNVRESEMDAALAWPQPHPSFADSYGQTLLTV